MSNFSNLLALSRQHGDQDRYEALRRSAEMRSRKMQLEAAERDRQAQREQSNAQLGFNYAKLDADTQTHRDQLSRQDKESAADRQNRLEIARLQGDTAKTIAGGKNETAKDLAGTKGEYDIEKTRIKGATYDAVTGKKIESAEKIASGRNETSRANSTDRLEGTKYTADTAADSKDRQLSSQEHKAEADRAFKEAQQQRQMAHQSKLVAMQLNNKSLLKNAELAEKHWAQHEKTALSYGRMANDPTADPKRLAELKAQLDELESNAPSMVSEQDFGKALNESVGPRIAPAKAQPNSQLKLSNDNEADEPAGMSERSEGEIAPAEAKVTAKKLGLSKSNVEPEPVKPSDVKPNPFMSKPVTTLKGLKGEEREQAVAATKAKYSKMPNPDEVYAEALKRGWPEAKATAAAEAARAQRQQFIDIGVPAESERAEYKQLTPKSENKTMLKDIVGMKTGNIEYEEPTGLTQAMKKASYGMLGARLPESVPLIGGSDVVPGSTKPLDAQNALTATGMMAIPGLAEKAAPYVAPVVDKIGGLLGKIPGAKLAQKGAEKLIGKTYNAASQAIDNQLANLPKLGATDAGAAMNNAAAEALPQVFDKTQSATSEMAKMLAGRAAPSGVMPEAPTPEPSLSMSGTMPPPIKPSMSAAFERPTIPMPVDSELQAVDNIGLPPLSEGGERLPWNAQQGMAPTPLPPPATPKINWPAKPHSPMGMPEPDGPSVSQIAQGLEAEGMNSGELEALMKTQVPPKPTPTMNPGKSRTPIKMEPPKMSSVLSDSLKAPTSDTPFQIFDQQLGQNIRFNNMNEFYQYLDNGGMQLPTGYSPNATLDFGKTTPGFKQN